MAGQSSEEHNKQSVHRTRHGFGYDSVVEQREGSLGLHVLVDHHLAAHTRLGIEKLNSSFLQDAQADHKHELFIPAPTALVQGSATQKNTMDYSFWPAPEPLLSESWQRLASGTLGPHRIAGP